jgi:hypothetical protein
LSGKPGEKANKLVARRGAAAQNKIAKPGARPFTRRMSVQRPELWQELFAGDQSGPAMPVKVRIIQRSGRPFLALPDDSRAAARSLALYAAQTPRARAAKSFLTLALKWKLPTGLPTASLSVNPKEPFAAFLAETAGSSELPRFAILSGNPEAEGRRFILLLFNEKDEPVAVVKAGLGEAAMRLIEHETAFLSSVPPQTPGAPRLRAKLRSPRLQALALDFFPGDSPDPQDEDGVERLLSAWIDTTRRVPIGELAAWQRLTTGAGPELPGSPLWRELQDAACHPVIYHGDFTPWNIKVTGDVWRVLDWERGEAAGVPGWDWFHYVVQSAVLVRREPPAALVERVEHLLASWNFERYATRAGIRGLERKLLLAYLNYSVRVLRQTEELPRVQALLNSLSESWLSGTATKSGAVSK